jgi:FAD:protein FMN transferase
MKSLSNEIRRARPLLGTLVEIGAAGEHAAPAIEAAFREIEIIHRLMSFHEIDSDIARLNRAPLLTAQQVDPRTYEVLSWAQKISALSDGAFDITVGAKLVTAGFLPKPADAEWPSEEANFRDLSLLSDNRVLLRRRAWIDLGGIAKGYAVDRAAATLKCNGVDSGIVNAGGDLYAFGAPQPIHIRHPEDASRLFSLGTLTDAAVASSSGCFTERREDGDSTDPLVDPRRNTTMRWQQSVTVVAPRCLIADALTKVVRLAPQRAAKILLRFGAQAVVIDRQGIRCSERPESRRESPFGRLAPLVSGAKKREVIASRIQ